MIGTMVPVFYVVGKKRSDRNEGRGLVRGHVRHDEGRGLVRGHGQQSGRGLWEGIVPSVN